MTAVHGSMWLDGKVAIVTGAAGVVGTALSKIFAAHGAQVILADVRDEIGHMKVSEIGSNAHYRHCDVTKEQDVASIVDFAVEKFGKLDIMCNNAGGMSPGETIETFDLDNYDRHNAVLVRGAIAGVKHAARVMIPMKQGVILNTADEPSFLDDSRISYWICKRAVPELTSIAACRLGKHGIQVNDISRYGFLQPMVLEWLNKPGSNTTFDPLGKTAEDFIAWYALFLCGADSDSLRTEDWQRRLAKEKPDRAYWLW